MAENSGYEEITSLSPYVYSGFSGTKCAVRNSRPKCVVRLYEITAAIVSRILKQNKTVVMLPTEFPACC